MLDPARELHTEEVELSGDGAFKLTLKLCADTSFATPKVDASAPARPRHSHSRCPPRRWVVVD